MGFDRVWRTRQGAGYLFVGVTTGELLQDFMLANRNAKGDQGSLVTLETCASRPPPPGQHNGEPSSERGEAQRDESEENFEAEGAGKIAEFQPFQREHADGERQCVDGCPFPCGAPASQTITLPAWSSKSR